MPILSSSAVYREFLYCVCKNCLPNRFRVRTWPRSVPRRSDIKIDNGTRVPVDHAHGVARKIATGERARGNEKAYVDLLDRIKSVREQRKNSRGKTVSVDRFTVCNKVKFVGA